MNRKQRDRQLARRRAHAARPDRPRNVMSRESYSAVKQGHIVPVVYQRNFSVGDRVTLYVDGRRVGDSAIQKTATRGPFYRRTRPDGTEIDDTEASLSYIEDAVRPVFDDLLAGAALTRDYKAVLAQFFGLQMVRGPAFVDQRTAVIDELVSGLRPEQFTPQLLRDVGGDLVVARERVRDAYLSKTQQVVTMLTTSMKLSAVIGSMRWHLLAFTEPVLVYSDHPVVVWPFAETTTTPFTTPRLAPLSAIEVRVPVSPQLALLMTWADEPDQREQVLADAGLAGELNAFTITQAERQWMHRPGSEPPIAAGPMTPLATHFETKYGPAAVEASARRARVTRYLHRVRNKRFLSEIEIVDIST